MTDTTDPSSRETMDTATSLPEDTTMDDVYEQLAELEETVDTKEELQEVHDVRLAIERLPGGAYVGTKIDRYTTRDVAEGFVGSIIISLPLLVEDGVYDIADHFLAPTVLGVPLWLVANGLFIVLMTWGLLYWADFRQLADENPFFGIVPRRLVGVLLISLFTASLTMTLWGRVDGWTNPDVAFARVSVIWTASAFGAAVGDLLPGESKGTDLGEIPGEVGDTLRSSE